MKSSREIVAEAWRLTIAHRAKLFKYGFVPAFFSIIVTGLYVYYQIEAFRHSKLFSGVQDHGFWVDYSLAILEFTTQSPLVLAFSIFVTITILLGWFFAPMMCRAAIAHLVAQSWRGEKMEHGFTKALFHFFPILEISLMKNALTPITFISEIFFIARNLTGALRFLMPLLIFLSIVGLIGLFFCSFTTQAIMLRDKGFTPAISQSFKTVAENISQTFRIMILFLLVELRVIINVLIVLFLPIALAALTGLFATLASEMIGIIIAAVFFFVLVFIASYLTGILFVFSEAMWTIAFLHFHGEERVKANHPQTIIPQAPNEHPGQEAHFPHGIPSLNPTEYLSSEQYYHR